jgi:hypothetical protein
MFVVWEAPQVSLFSFSFNALRYTCPRCSTRSCSVACVTSHKKVSGCDGVRNVTEFVALDDFDDAVMLSGSLLMLLPLLEQTIVFSKT